MQYHLTIDEGIVLTMANSVPDRLLIFAFRPCLHPAAFKRGTAESKKYNRFSVISASLR
jgi:hypothetical protein